MNNKLTLLVVLLALTMVLPACGGKKVQKTEGVTGKVTLDGRDIREYDIKEFYSQKITGFECSGRKICYHSQ